MAKAGYDIILRRPPPMGELRRYGQAVGGIDAKFAELVAKYPRLNHITIK